MEKRVATKGDIGDLKGDIGSLKWQVATFGLAMLGVMIASMWAFLQYVSSACLSSVPEFYFQPL